MSQFGKWSESRVPHKGWSCVGFEDLGEPSTVCEMCEHQEIRYVHTMRHPDYPDLLEVGAVCAENMEEDYTSARWRESNAKSIAGKLSRFMDSPNWRTTLNGNWRINRHGCVIVISEKYSWGYWITQKNGPLSWSQWSFDTEEEAKRAAFYKLQIIIEGD